jgi:L-rhamnonate dehydratase
MKITQVQAIELRLPHVHGERCAGTQDTLLIRIHTDEGITGIGEVDSSPAVARAVVHAPVSHMIARGLQHVLLGADPLDTEVLWHRMYQASIYFGRRGAAIHAMAGVDLALWDIKGKALGQPVWKLLGGRFHDRIRAYGSILFGDTPKETEQIGRSLVKRRFTAVKFGWGPMGKSEAGDLAHVEAARRGIGDEAMLMIDAGCCYDTRTAMKRERQFRPFNPTWLEEPLHPDNLEGYAKLAAHSETPIAAGEGEATYDECARLIDEANLDILQLDPARMGLTQIMKVCHLARARHRRVVNHSYKTYISIAASLHFLATVPDAFVLEYCVEDSPLLHELTHETFPLDAKGMVTIPDAPGLGVTVNEQTIEEYGVEVMTNV